MTAKSRKTKKEFTGGRIKARIPGNAGRDVIPAKDKNPDDLEIE